MKSTKTQHVFRLLKKRAGFGLTQLDLMRMLRSGELTEDSFVTNLAAAIKTLRVVHNVEIGQMQEVVQGRKYQRYFYISGEYRNSWESHPGPVTEKVRAKVLAKNPKLKLPKAKISAWKAAGISADTDHMKKGATPKQRKRHPWESGFTKSKVGNKQP